MNELSFEFFPPKTAKGSQKLIETSKLLAKFKPAFFSVTFGAGGSTQKGTPDSIFAIKEATQIEVAPHISCIGGTQKEIEDMLTMYQEKGINRLVALRGDIPPGTDGYAGELHYANELVRFIRETTGDHFHIEVAAYPEFHPQSENALQDMNFFQEKVEAGANSALTQYFYNPDAYYRFIEECNNRNINIPITPGIMPIHNFEKLKRFSSTCGAEIPQWILKRLEAYGDDLDSIQAFGIEIVTHLCENLLEQGAPGLHFYTLNSTEPTISILKNLKIE